MTYFLEHIAESLYKEFGNTLNRHCLVFPNRRAGIYFMKYLAARIEKPVWAPSVLTINELFRSFSLLQIPGNEILLFELYKVYDNLKKPHESFDEFYHWGDMLLNDFEDVDKYLADASVLFRNVIDLKNIDEQFGGLTEQQVEIIRRFWTNFNFDKPTNEKRGFISIWSVLSDLYTGFRETLRKQNLAYEGMVFRDVAQSAETLNSFDSRWDMVHFIGFNALNNCEKALMKAFKKSAKARFYWDYDNSYINESRLNSAGFFLKENIKMFGSDMPSGWSFDTNLTKNAPAVYRRVIDTSSDVAQVKLVSGLLEEIPGINNNDAHHTAVVLADENLLMPVLTSLPEKRGDINITMGHPLKQSLVYTLIRHLMDLHSAAAISDGVVHFASGNVISILKHPLLNAIFNESDNELAGKIAKTGLSEVTSDWFSESEILSFIFKKISTPAELSGYLKDILSFVASGNKRNTENNKNIFVQTSIMNEFIYRVVLSLNRLESIINTPAVPFTLDTYIKIFDRLLRMQSVPFSGEPLSGIQIMGILETRALDFKNLIILSVNEGVLPAISSGSSFIPFSLREAFGLPSLNHQESIYAYHFYRLLQRAENVTFIYNSNSEGLRSGEMSRFLVQMKYNETLKPVFFDSGFEIKTPMAPGDRIDRENEHSEMLASLFLDKKKEKPLSPSAINTWLNCRMKFFYRYINRLKEPENISKEIDPAMLGNILHSLMKNIYAQYVGKELNGEIISGLIGNRQFLAKNINEELIKTFQSGRYSSVSGNELIVRDVLMAYLSRILHTDKLLAPFTILNLEETFNFLLPFVAYGSELNVLIGGNIDRIDILNKVTRIVDYKTGTISESVKYISDLFTDDRKKDTDGWLQTLLYCEAYLAGNPESIVRPSIYKIKRLNSPSTDDRLKISSGTRNDLPIDNYLEIREEFLSCLKDLMSIIFSHDEPFLKTKDRRGKCSYCPYRTLCMR